MRTVFPLIMLCVAGVAATAGKTYAEVIPASDSAENSSVVSADGTGDYTSLRDAFAALSGSFTAVPDHTIYIASDLQETQPLVLNRNSGLNSKLIIKPLGAPRTVHVISGPASSYNDLAGIACNTNFSSPPYICNTVIDGTLEGTTRGLTLDFSHTETSPSQQSAHHGIVFGGNGSMEIKNCEILHNPLTETNSYAVKIETAVQRPVTITGCRINAATPSSSALYVRAGNPGATPPAADVIIRNNEILARHHGLSVYSRDAIVDANSILVDGPPDRFDTLLGIVVSRSYSPTTSTLIRDNRISITGGESSTVAQGIRMYSGSDTNGLLQIHNNMISLSLETGVESRAICGITNVWKRPDVAEVAHNSIFLPGNQTNNEETSRYFHGIGVDAQSSNSITIVNNMLRVGSRWGSGMFLHSGNNIISNGNVIGTSGDAVAVTSEQTTYTLLADWQTASGSDNASQSVDPLPMWASPDDLHLVHSTAGLQPGVTGLLAAPVEYDIDGDSRNTTTPTPGADEASLAAKIGDWSAY